MPIFTNATYELAKRIIGLNRGCAVAIATEKYTMSEAAAHEAIAMFIGAQSGLVQGKIIELADALTNAKLFTKRKTDYDPNNNHP
jgi:hypothetical protein